MAVDYQKAINELLVEHGQKKDKFYQASFTTKQVLEKLGIPNALDKQRYVVTIVNTMYPGSRIERASGDAGFILHVRTRVK